LNQNQKDVLQFHDACDVVTPESPTVVDHKVGKLRVSLILEEAAELAQAYERGKIGDEILLMVESCDEPSVRVALYNLGHKLKSESIVAVGDALADTLYVTHGAGCASGLDLDPLFTEVHSSNMTKVMDDGKVHKRSDGKILKPDTFREPDLESVVVKQGLFRDAATQ